MKNSFKIIVGIFTGIGIVFSGVFIAMQFGWLNVRGTITERNNSFMNISNTRKERNTKIESRAVLLCKIHTLAEYAPQTAQAINQVLETGKDSLLVIQMIESASVRFGGNEFNQKMTTCEKVLVSTTKPLAQTAYAWADSEEWSVMKSAFTRDQEYITKAAKDAGISPRILLGGVIGEQFRFFTNARDSFKRYFEPLKILASLSQFSFGIAGLKPETVARIDQNLKNPSSVFYLGKEMENIITYPAGSNEENVRFNRITDTQNTYYSYLYTGLFMRQVSAQWAKSDVDISKNPGVLATLYNLGFNRSIPKTEPRIGGAPITVNGQQYTFGDLAHEFYYSGELMDIFPY